MATRIALLEAGGTADFRQVDLKTKRLEDGSDFLAINPLGQVPVLRLENGALLTENPVVLQYVADRFPRSNLASQTVEARYCLQQWLNFITSELHKLVFTPLLDPMANEGARQYAHEKAELRLGYLDSHLQGRETVLDGFTITDAYLITVLNWSRTSGIDLAKWPAIKTYMERLLKRPSVAKALADEFDLHNAKLKRKAET